MTAKTLPSERDLEIDDNILDEAEESDAEQDMTWHRAV